MAFLNWTSEYDLGVEAMDRQHRHLVELINQLHTAMKNGAPRSEIYAVFEGLATYTQTHFAAEEGYMRQLGYPDVAAHQRLHRELVARLGELWRDFQTGRMTVSLELSRFLKGWLLNHILENDRKYAAVALGR
jgi:hemerythrin-like metal-binding protein